MFARRLVLAAFSGIVLHGVAYPDTPPVQSFDAEITNRVVHELMRADAEVAPRIRVSTLNGIVTLEGTVFTPSQVLKIAGDARKVSGVVQVKNRLHPQM